jgi:hypothetical protein
MPVYIARIVAAWKRSSACVVPAACTRTVAQVHDARVIAAWKRSSACVVPAACSSGELCRRLLSFGNSNRQSQTGCLS